MSEQLPVYVETKQSGRLREKINTARKRLSSCDLCPRECRVDRLMDEVGVCGVGETAILASFNSHFGEEPPLVGVFGSGTIFFSHCNLQCDFCQNYDISCAGEGEEASMARIATTMLTLQNSGCHNINLVTPSHVVPQILAALDMAIDAGLHIPLVYNSGGYDAVSTLELLDGVVDIYMPDFKFWDPEVADRYCRAPDYPEVARKVLVEMWRQVGDLTVNEIGVATRGLLIRHLVLPHGLAGTGEVARFIAERVSKNSYINVMDQYRPCGDVMGDKDLGRRPTEEEYQSAVDQAKAAGLHRFA